jgi:hypothetical protein
VNKKFTREFSYTIFFIYQSLLELFALISRFASLENAQVIFFLNYSLSKIHILSILDITQIINQILVLKQKIPVLQLEARQEKNDGWIIRMIQAN